MTAYHLLIDLRRAGVVLTAEGERLTFDAPPGAMTPELREAVKERKPELLALLAGDYAKAALLLVQGVSDPERREALAFQFDERAAIAEIDGARAGARPCGWRIEKLARRASACPTLTAAVEPPRI